LQHLVLSHLSQQNNCAKLARDMIETIMHDMSFSGEEGFAVACQDRGFDWRVIV